MKRWPIVITLLILSRVSAGAESAANYSDPSVPVEERITALISAMTIEEKVQALGTNPSVPRLGLRLARQIEGLHGVALGGPGSWGRTRGADGQQVNVPVITTTFPQEVGLGETWDVDVVRRVAAIEGMEARYAFHSEKYQRGGLVVRAPNADLARDPRWGRTEESFGEDPFLTGSMATAFVRGLQGDDPKYWQAAALLKHFMANSNENGRSSSSSNFDERLMREYYSVPFRMAIVQGGARAFMASYNEWNGTPMTIHPILKSMAVEEWGLDGIICTDGGAMTQLVTDHKRFATLEEAAAASIHAGISQFLDRQVDPVTKALERGLISEADIDGRLRGIYRTMIRLGLLDPPDLVPYTKIPSDEPWLTAEHRDAVRWATRKSIVLLKNNGVLPLERRKLKSVAVVGPYADQVLLDWYSGTPPYVVSPLEGIRAALGSGTEVRFSPNNDGGAAAKIAKPADVVIAVVGNHPTCNAGWNQCPVPSDGKESVDRRTIDLEQEQLVRELLSVNPRTIVVLASSFPFSINWTQGHAPAIVHLTHNSQEMGHALADVLFGDYNPAGRLVHTWPKSVDDLPPMMDYDIRNGRTYMYAKHKPLYPFGFGLSYTRFVYSNVRLSTPRLTADGKVDVEVTVRNTGKRSGEEVVQVYVQHVNSRVARPERALKAFKRIELAGGQKVTTRLPLAARDFAYWDETAHRFVVEPGTLRILVGASSSDIRGVAQLEIEPER